MNYFLSKVNDVVNLLPELRRWRWELEAHPSDAAYMSLHDARRCSSAYKTGEPGHTGCGKRFVRQTFHGQNDGHWYILFTI